MVSGMLVALTTSSSRNPELLQHYERLILKLQDPYLRALLTHLTVREWREVLEEDSLPLRERLAIAFQFLDDKDVSSYLRGVAERAVHDGDIHGLFVTGLTGAGMDLLQAYVDSSGDVQTAALLAALSPALAHDSRAMRWMDTYHDLLDGWRFFHQRCQLDIERGRILKDAVEGAEIAPFEWAPRQALIRCNYCNKSIEAPLPADNQPRVSGHPVHLPHYSGHVLTALTGHHVPSLWKAAAAMLGMSHDVEPRARECTRTKRHVSSFLWYVSNLVARP